MVKISFIQSYLGRLGLRHSVLVRGALVVEYVDSSPDRMNEYTHVEDHVFGDKVGGRGADYARYVEDTVRPFIELGTGRHGWLGS